MSDNTRRLQVGPFNRVEGDLDIRLDIATDTSDASGKGNGKGTGTVNSARVNSTLFRGFEQMLVGKPAMDALVYTPRICGICSVAQSVACANALANAGGVQPTANGIRSQNLLLANESLTDLLTHFYLFFMPDMARPVYQQQSWYEPVAERFQAIKGNATKQVLPARAQFLHLMGLMAGHWPHSMAIQPGGSSKAVTRQERLRVISILAEFRRFLETTLFGADLDAINELDSVSALTNWAAQDSWQSSDLRTFLHLSDQLTFSQLGRATDKLMSMGNYPQPDLAGSSLSLQVSRGLWLPTAGLQPLNTDAIKEDVSHSWVEDGSGAEHPAQGHTEVSLASSEKPHAYSWCKAPRLNGEVVETGALARAVVSQRPLMTELMQQQGATVHTRMLARLLELAWMLPQMQQWAKDLQVDQPYCNNTALAKEGEGAAMMEAARGSLGHWIRLKNGRISHYQIVAPTTWNFSPRDEQGQPGPLEQALEGAPVMAAEKDPIAVQHIVRSFDPCMVCTVH
ncbi:nickel-dependent hydrogenase large subunit [Oceanobacter kriegii]|uniref:nickel-dependent hydrogenase large subunit n=1 Tax=Oceanobacter kriegii TaxID=64972 RepID=UPI00040C4893|nr:nickel-dependent hydrogenase large subunit [Oceanobacter kriegii]